jgi:hypothetical protein
MPIIPMPRVIFLLKNKKIKLNLELKKKKLENQKKNMRVAGQVEYA